VPKRVGSDRETDILGSDLLSEVSLLEYNDGVISGGATWLADQRAMLVAGDGSGASLRPPELT